MPFNFRILISAVLFAITPSGAAVLAQEQAAAPAKKGVITPDTRAKGINDSQPADLSSGQEHKEFDWSGTYAGMHGGTLGTPGHGN
ncbi:MAG TPA: hypothetical protein VIE66_03440 [Methylocella sp.]|jgi:hypothetical protein